MDSLQKSFPINIFQFLKLFDMYLIPKNILLNTRNIYFSQNNEDNYLLELQVNNLDLLNYKQKYHISNKNLLLFNLDNFMDLLYFHFILYKNLYHLFRYYSHKFNKQHNQNNHIIDNLMDLSYFKKSNQHSIITIILILQLRYIRFPTFFKNLK